jgi:hypothetical protein
MRTTFTVRSRKSDGKDMSKRYWYYVSRSKEGDGSPVTRLPAAALEQAAAEAIAAKLADRGWLLDRLQENAMLPASQANWQRIAEIATSLRTGEEEQRASTLRDLIRRIDLGSASLRITLELAPLVDGADASKNARATFDAPCGIRQYGRARSIVIRSGDAPRRDPDLIAVVADARRWMAELLEGDATTAAEITSREGLRKGAVSRILPLAWLAPDIATAILEGRQPPALTAKRLRDLPEIPLCWHDQRALLGFPAD